jgi:hypothetical protein
MTSSSNQNLLNCVAQLIDRLENLIPPLPEPTQWGDSIAFRWRHDRHQAYLQAVTHVSKVQLADLQCIERQKQQLDQNTRQFVNGFPANNALLWGPRGTGKSSLIKAILNEYSDQGLRLIEVEKKYLEELPDIAEQLYDRPEKFIIFCDDLSFEADDASYKSLKVVLDGSINSTPENILIYASSNRRHLIPEYDEDNVGAKLIDTEIHFGEAVEEKISLSERFGLWLAFHPFNQNQYLTIVDHWLQQLDVKIVDPEACKKEALKWALLHGSRSGRSAWQFARDFAGKTQLETL